MEKTDRLIAMQMTGETTVIEFRQSPPSIKFVEVLVGGQTVNHQFCSLVFCP